MHFAAVLDGFSSNYCSSCTATCVCSLCIRWLFFTSVRFDPPPLMCCCCDTFVSSVISASTIRAM